LKNNFKYMANKKLLIIVLIVISLLVIGIILLKNYQKSKCGDSICQKWEQKNGSCSIDCNANNGKNFPDSTTYKVKNVRTLTNKGGRVEWGPNNIIAFDRKEKDGNYDIWTINLDGMNEKCLTCNKSNIPQGMNGNPSWHPSGKFIAFQSEDTELFSKLKILERFARTPGGGLNNNLWITNADGSQFWQITQVAARMGVLHPKFSYDGKKILWAEKVSYDPESWGSWVMKVADFMVENGEPKLTNIIEVKPGNMQFYETNGFSPDNSKIIYSAFPEDKNKKTYYSKLTALDEFFYDLKTQKVTRLTNTPLEWDEFAKFSPDGQKIVFMSSQDTAQNRDKNGDIVGDNLRSDFWIMDADGSNQQRLSHFNVPGYQEYSLSGITVATFGFSPDGKALAVKIRRLPSKFDEAEEIVIIELEK